MGNQDILIKITSEDFLKYEHRLYKLSKIITEFFGMEMIDAEYRGAPGRDTLEMYIHSIYFREAIFGEERDLEEEYTLIGITGNDAMDRLAKIYNRYMRLPAHEHKTVVVFNSLARQKIMLDIPLKKLASFKEAKNLI